MHRTHDGTLYGVFDCDQELPDRGFYLSSETSSQEGENGIRIDTVLTGAAVVDQTAQTFIDLGRYVHGPLDDSRVRQGWNLSHVERRIVEAAATTQRNRDRYSRDPLEVFDDAPPEVVLRRRSFDNLNWFEQQELLEDQARARQRRPPIEPPPGYTPSPPDERPPGKLRYSAPYKRAVIRVY